MNHRNRCVNRKKIALFYDSFCFYYDRYHPESQEPPGKKSKKNVLTGGLSGDFTTKKRIGLSETVVFFSRSQTGGVAEYYIPISPARNVQAFTTVYFKGDPDGEDGNIQISTTN